MSPLPYEAKCSNADCEMRKNERIDVDKSNCLEYTTVQFKKEKPFGMN